MKAVLRRRREHRLVQVEKLAFNEPEGPGKQDTENGTSTCCARKIVCDTTSRHRHGNDWMGIARTPWLREPFTAFLPKASTSRGSPDPTRLCKLKERRRLSLRLFSTVLLLNRFDTIQAPCKGHCGTVKSEKAQNPSHEILAAFCHLRKP
jgi:hypothetical protein